MLVLTPGAFGALGGIAKYNRDLLRSLCSMAECETVVALPMLMENEPGPLPTKLEYLVGGLGQKRAYIGSAWRVSRQRFDLVLCAHINLLPLASLVAVRVGAPLVLLVYGVEAWRPPRRGLTRCVVRGLSGVIAISDITLERFVAWSGFPRERVRVVSNAIDIGDFAPGTRNPDLVERYDLHGKRVLMTLGRFSSEERYKGVDEMLELLPQLIATVPDLVYMIIGDGDDKERLLKRSRDLGVSSCAIFVPSVPESEKAEYYRLADAYVMPGRGEGFGFVFLEAMACGVPVVGSRVDGSREALRNGELGILVDPDDEEEISSAIIRALNSPKVVPLGLEYFGFPRFEKRIHEVVRWAMTQGRVS